LRRGMGTGRGVREWLARFERSCASPRNVNVLFQMFLDLDVRDIVSSIHVPTLILHRTQDYVVNVRSGRWLAEHIPGARLIELPGIDHVPFTGDVDALVDEMQEFITGTRERAEPDRVLTTVMCTDISGSTTRAPRPGEPG